MLCKRLSLLGKLTRKSYLWKFDKADIVFRFSLKLSQRGSPRHKSHLFFPSLHLQHPLFPLPPTPVKYFSCKIGMISRSKMGSFSIQWKVTYTHSIYRRWLWYFVLQNAFMAYSSTRRKFLNNLLWNSLCLKKDQVQLFPIRHLFCHVSCVQPGTVMSKLRKRQIQRETEIQRGYLWMIKVSVSALVSQSKFQGSWKLVLRLTLCPTPARCWKETSVMGCRDPSGNP